MCGGGHPVFIVPPKFIFLGISLRFQKEQPWVLMAKPKGRLPQDGLDEGRWKGALGPSG